jgi:hypothetical protein
MVLLAHCRAKASGVYTGQRPRLTERPSVTLRDATAPSRIIASAARVGAGVGANSDKMMWCVSA